MKFYILRSDLNLFTATLLIIVYFSTKSQLNNGSKTAKYIKMTTFSCTLTTIIEGLFLGLIIYLNSKPTTIILSLFAFLYPIFSTHTSFFYGLFLYYYSHNNSKLSKLYTFLYYIPLTICCVLQIYNLKYGITHTIDTVNGTFIRSKYAYISYIFPLIYILYSFIVVLKNYKKLNNQEISILSCIGIFPIVSSVLQVINFGTFILWPACCVTITALLVFLQNKLSLYDKLTGAWDRTSFDSFLDQQSKKNYTDYSLTFIDMDDFKFINDNYGHNEGDFALKKFVELIKEKLPDDSFITRYGGDEFIVYINYTDKEKIENVLDNIHQNIDEYNKKSNKGYDLKYSYSYDVYDPTLYTTTSQLIREIDNRMYKNKQQKKLEAGTKRLDYSVRLQN